MNTVAAPETPFLRAAPELQRLPPVLRSDRVRLVKDALRVGRWYAGDDANGNSQYRDWDDAALERLVQRFNEHLKAGITHPLCWGHRQPLRSDIDETQAIADIAQMWVEDGRLWFAVYVTEEQAKELTEKHRQCSVGLWPDWEDGSGKLWPGYSLMHMGIVPHAIVPGQHSFIEMAAKPPKGKRMTFDVVKEAINQLLEAVKPGTTLPDTVDESNIDDVLPMLISVVLGKPAEEEAPAEEAPPVLEDTSSEAPMEMSAALKPLVDEINALKALIAGQRANEAEKAFRSRAAELGSAGVHAGTIATCLEMGAKLNWDLTVLDTAAKSSGKPLEMGSKLGSRRDAKPNKPVVLTDAEIEAAKAAMAARLPGGGRK